MQYCKINIIHVCMGIYTVHACTVCRALQNVTLICWLPTIAPWLGTPCATKRVHPQLLPQDGALNKVAIDFVRECRTWKDLRHPHIVQFLGVAPLAAHPCTSCTQLHSTHTIMSCAQRLQCLPVYSCAGAQSIS